MKIVAEIGLTHEGSLGAALRSIDAAAWAGAHAVKFQCHDGDPVDRFRPGTEFPQDWTRKDYWRRTAFRRHEWERLAAHARMQKLAFGCSVFSVEASQAVGYVCDFLKIGSAQASNDAVLRAVAEQGKPVVLSTGMSDWKEIDNAVRALWKYGTAELTILQCASKYPSDAADVGINVALQIRDRYCRPPHFGRKWGLSDHSGTIWPGLLAAWFCADMIEVHLVQSRWQFGPDATSSLDPAQLRELVEGVEYTRMLVPVDKDQQAAEMQEMREAFRG